MFIHHNPSNIVRAKEGVIVHGCNAQGIMGSGVAKQLRAKYPEIFFDYVLGLKEYALQKLSPLGTLSVVPVSKTLKIVNAITQEFYGRDGVQYVSYVALETAFANIATRFDFTTPIHIPYLIGAGLGGGDEKTILELIDKNLKDHEVHFHHWK